MMFPGGKLKYLEHGGAMSPTMFCVLTPTAHRGYNKGAKAEYRGVAHLVERLVWDQEARSSSLRTSTSIENRRNESAVFVISTFRQM